MLPEVLIFITHRVVLHSLILESGYTPFGRGAGNAIRLDNPAVSRDHGAFSYRAGVLSIEDHHSRNGIFVNGLRMHRKVLYSGDYVLIGCYKVFVKHGSEQPRHAFAG
ncbi:FHA domain-containing protein [Comamonas piscis]|uniref:FHA domain-containing protein n=1 Tax=Comamonas piscis TaxID=1562974 RepID=A0A7G5EG69_9BURK|nr:FHA domain-containing protein [Comamonas piscis]QMV72994.1 FHA domain-containing protein [Comamonas piscis]WSO35777.1 FHA domain-containing protein [Comamonas piscis]